MNEVNFKRHIEKDFSKTPHWINDSGILATFNGNTAKVLINLIRRADYTTGIGRVGNKRISKEAGVSYSSVSGCLKKLKFAGVIKVWRNGWVRYYQILSKPSSTTQEWLEMFTKKDRLPKKSETYLRDAKTGRFIKKVNSP